MLTREQFIAQYLTDAKGVLLPYGTPDGYHYPGFPRQYAMLCYCGDDECTGWAMIPEHQVEDHARRNSEWGYVYGDR